MNQYFKEARSWADDCFGQMEKSRNRYKVAFLSAMGFSAIAIGAVAVLSSWQTVVPLVVHHYDNGVVTVEQGNESNLPASKAQTESDLVRYVQHRESFDTSSFRSQFNLVSLLSNNQVAGEYHREQARNSKESHVKTLGATVRRETHVYSIHFLDSLAGNDNDIKKDHQNLAEVIFSIKDIDKDNGRIIQTAHHTALLSWRYIGMPASPEDRWQNFNGFEVTRYTKQARVVEASR